MSGAAKHNQTKAENKKANDKSAHINLKVKGLLWHDVDEFWFSIKKSAPLKELMDAYCEQEYMEINSIGFIFAGRQLHGEMTPDELEMKDGDMIVAMKLLQGKFFCFCRELDAPLIAGAVAWNGMAIRSDFLPVLQRIEGKYGDVFANMLFQNPLLKSTFAEVLAKCVSCLDRNRLASLCPQEERLLGQAVLDLEMAGVAVSWLKARVEEVGVLFHAKKKVEETKAKLRKAEKHLRATTAKARTWLDARTRFDEKKCLEDEVELLHANNEVLETKAKLRKAEKHLRATRAKASTWLDAKKCLVEEVELFHAKEEVEETKAKLRKAEKHLGAMRAEASTSLDANECLVEGLL